MSRHILAITIGSTALSGLLLIKGIKSNTIEDHIYIPLDRSGLDDPLPPALSSLAAHINVANAEVVVALPAEQAVFRTLTVPFKDIKKIGQILPFELEQTLPMPVDSLVIDFQPRFLNESTEVLAAGMDRQQIEQVLQTFEAASLKPQLIVPSGFALLHALGSCGQPMPEHFLLLDADQDKATLFALVREQVCLVRTLPFETTAGDPTQALALRIQQTLTAFCDTKAIDFSPSLLFISGTGLPVANSADALGQALSIPVEPVDLRQVLSTIDFSSTITAWDPAMDDGALALALFEAEGRSTLHFHRSGSAFRTLWTTYKQYLKGPALLMAILLILSLGGILLDIHLLQKRVDQINTQIREAFTSVFPDVKRIVDPMVQMQAKMEEFKKGAVDPTQTGEQVRCIDILYQISQLIPKENDVLLNRLTVGQDGITISGETSGFNVVDDVKGRLEKSELFAKVTIAAANMDKSGNKVQFRLKIEL